MSGAQPKKKFFSSEFHHVSPTENPWMASHHIQNKRLSTWFDYYFLLDLTLPHRPFTSCLFFLWPWRAVPTVACLCILWTGIRTPCLPQRLWVRCVIFHCWFTLHLHCTLIICLPLNSLPWVCLVGRSKRNNKLHAFLVLIWLQKRRNKEWTYFSHFRPFWYEAENLLSELREVSLGSPTGRFPNSVFLLSSQTELYSLKSQ